jgi:hypothetical protein
MSRSDRLALARQLLAEGKTRYETLKAVAETRVVDWECSDGPRFSLEPGRFLVWGTTRRGQPKAVAPDALDKFDHAYGFDAEGRLVLTRVGGARPSQYQEDFYEHSPDSVVEYRFEERTPKRLAGVCIYTHSNDPMLIVAIDAAHQRGRWAAFRYRYEGQRLVEATLLRGSPHGRQLDYRDFEYDDEGRLSAVWWRYPDGRREKIALARR